MISIYRKRIFLLLLALILTGCWDSQDVNERTVTFSSGVDYVNNNIELCGEVAKIQANLMGGKETSKEIDLFIYDAFGKTLEEARGDFNNKNALPNFAGTIRAIVIGKNYADKDIMAYVNRTFFIPELRSSVLVVVSKEPIKELFSKKVENEVSVGYAIENTIRTLSNNGGAIYKTIQEIQSDMMFKDIGFLLSYVTNENRNIQNLGLVAMKDSKSVGTISTKESRGYLYIISKKMNFSSAIRIDDNRNLLSIRTNLKERKIKTEFKENKVNIYVDFKFDSQLDYEYEIQPLYEEDYKKIEETISKKINEEITSAVKTSQKQFQSDVFGFARYFKAQNPREYRNINWREEYPKAIVHVNVVTKFTKTNLLNPNGKRIK